MKLLKKYFSIFNRTILILFIFFSLFSYGQKNVSRYIAKFEYQPQTRTQVANSGITVCLIKPFFDGNNGDNFAAPLEQFKGSMQEELQNLLIAKGFRVRGPFKTRDEMVFEDKKQSDFTLVVSIHWDAIENRNIKAIHGPGGFKDKNGEVNISSSLDVTAISNFSGEKIWRKHLSLDPQHILWVGSVDLGKTAQVAFWDEYNKDNALAEPLGKALEATYKSCMEFLWNQFDISEMKNVADEAKTERSTEREQKK